MALRETDIFRYTDFRAFLKDALQELKERDGKFSQRFILMRIGIKSSGWLADVLGSRRNLGRSHLLALARVLDLGPREELYFETLVDYAQARSLFEKKRAYEKLLSFHEIPKDIIESDRFEYFSKWFYPAVREYLLIEPFRGDFVRLARRIRPAITPSQAKEAIELLERLGFIRRLASGEFRPVTEHVKKQSSFSSVHYYQYLKEHMALGVDALERLPREERDFSAVTVTLSDEGFRALRDEIKTLRQKLIQWSETENHKFWEAGTGDSRRVFQTVFEVFPVSVARSAKETEA